jgi:hypothetical protein
MGPSSFVRLTSSAHELCQLCYHGELFFAVQGTLVGQDLHAYIGFVTIHIGECACWQLVHEGGGVFAEHRDIRHSLDRFHRSGRINGQLLRIGKCPSNGVDIDHWHSVPLSVSMSF